MGTKTKIAAAFVAGAGLIGLIGSVTWADPPHSPAASAHAATVPATGPAIPPPTPEQQKLIHDIEATPCDQPAPKLDLSTHRRDRTPNPNFGKLNERFAGKHQEFLARGKKGPIGVLFLGDSITEGWNRGSGPLWAEYEKKYQAANFGISGDQTQHVLWRIQNGELDGIAPKVLVLMIGTNNVRHWRPEEVLKGDMEIVRQIRQKLPDTKVLLLAVFPHGADPANKGVAELRRKHKVINDGLAKLNDGDKIRYLDIGDKFLDADGKLPKDVMPDSLHPNAKGYEIWDRAMRPVLDEMLSTPTTHPSSRGPTGPAFDDGVQS